MLRYQVLVKETPKETPIRFRSRRTAISIAGELSRQKGRYHRG